ncbi:hypothetical protein D9619_009863 [Psilocybe cf. subviscida]|uniref:F-box domain-containing protein n=1 Tax=Psilocybe cf. subviscida TaxID=2480587 RepID=A0A8H5F6F3_9AGAR|nr:hypothetical protein D9619_009863 [Psilocybe cf. subviscida]
MDILSNGIPPELASEIFAFCALQNPLILCSVSKQWQAIAWATPCLWTSITVAIKPSTMAETLPTTAHLVRQWLTRSGALPLKIHLAYRGSSSSSTSIDYTLLYPLIDLFNAHANRWRYLALDIPSFLFSRFLGDPAVANALEVLQLNVIDSAKSNNPKFDLINAVPHPKSLFVVNMPLQSINICWNNIINLEIATGSLLDIIQMLPQATSLVHCKFDRLFLPMNADIVLGEPIVVPHLRTLEFLSFNNAISELLNAVTLPSLEDLSISFRVSSGLPEDTLVSLLDRSSCPLTSLRLGGVIVDESTFIHFLYALPVTLKTFSIASYHTDIYPVFTDDLFHEMVVGTSKPDSDHATQRLLPNLETLEYEGTCTFSWTNLFRAISPLQLNPDAYSESDSTSSSPISSHRPLRNLMIRLQDYDIEPMTAEDLLSAIHLRKAGLNLDIRHLHDANGRSDWISLCLWYHHDLHV